MNRGLLRAMSAYGVATLALTFVLGCKVDERKVRVSSPDGGASSAVGALEPGPSGAPGSSAAEGQDPSSLAGIAAGSMGAACGQGIDCDSGHCVDEVCCDSPCTELCAACNLPGSVGVCSAAASDALCPEASCQGQSSECRPLNGGQTTANCEAVGVCRANAQCVALPAAQGVPCQAGTGTCDGQGACLVPDKSALGVACEVDDDCAEGHCVASGDGARVCCDAACDGVCQACSAAGRCETTPATDARCTAVTCPADNVCRDYVDTIADNLCRAFGQCRDALDCGAPGAFTALRPSAQCVCDPASGGCSLAVGTACALDGECASGACAQTAQGNRICCSGACGAGSFCNAAGTGCVQCEGSQVDCDGNVQRTCDAGTLVTATCNNGCTPGVGCNALPPVGFLCGTGQCAPGGVCQQDVAGQARCCVRNCAAEGKVCSPSGSCECPPGQVAAGAGCQLEPGDPCQNSAQCQTGHACVDGVCCQEACGGYCERCQAGTGLCVAIPAGQQELDPTAGNDCSNGFECTGVRGDCRARTGQACTSNDGSDCVSGACEPTAGGGARVCCSQACDGVLGSCRSNGQGCVQCESAAQCGNGCNVVQGTCNALRAAGETCSVAGQCSTNACVRAADGNNLSRCCANCAFGQLCTAQGQCINPQSELGGNCTVNADCRVGVCSSGICCQTACDESCETCSASGTCESNGQCDAFDCIAPDPPSIEVSFPLDNVFLLGATAPPAANGGNIRNGRYVPSRVDIYGELSADGQVQNNLGFNAYEFRGRSVQVAAKDYFSFSPPTGFLPEMHYAGTYSTTGATLRFDVAHCDVQFGDIPLSPEAVSYTATPNGLIVTSVQGAHTVVTSYILQ